MSNNINMNMEMRKIQLKNRKKRNFPTGKPCLTVQKPVGSRNLKISKYRNHLDIRCSIIEFYNMGLINNYNAVLAFINVVLLS